MVYALRNVPFLLFSTTVLAMDVIFDDFQKNNMNIDIMLSYPMSRAIESYVRVKKCINNMKILQTLSMSILQSL